MAQLLAGVVAAVGAACCVVLLLSSSCSSVQPSEMEEQRGKKRKGWSHKAKDMDAIPSDVLKLILPCIDSPVCLIRAASTCRDWRRIITNDGFLGRFLSLHAACVTGVYYNSSTLSPNLNPPDFILSPVGAAINNGHFSLDFLPDGNAIPWVWRIIDSRGSLLLFNRLPSDARSTLQGKGEVVICEPLTRRFERISPFAGYADGYALICAYLIDGDSGNASCSNICMSNFRVLCVLYGNYRYHARLYTSGGSWHEISINSERLDFLMDIMGHDLASLQYFFKGGIGSQRMDLMGLTAETLYWYTGGRTVVALNRSTTKITSFLLPGTEDWDRLSMSGLMRFIDGPNGRVRLIISESGNKLKIYVRIQGGHGSEWAMEKTMRIHVPMVAGVVSSSQYKPWELLTICAPLIMVSPYDEDAMWRLCLDAESVEAERVAGIPYPCELPWPPVFRFCTDRDDDAT